MLQEPDGVPLSDAGAVVDCSTGRVVGIIRRNWQARGYCGSLENPKFKVNPGRNVRVLFRPKKKKIPPIWVRTSQLEQLLGKRVVCVIDSWENDSRFPSGHYVRMIGNMGDKDAETVSFKPSLANSTSAVSSCIDNDTFFLVEKSVPFPLDCQ